jgi:hypothetical protein
MEYYKIEVNQLENELNLELLNICRKKIILNGLKELQRFVNSEVWKNIHDKHNSHDFIYEMMNQLFGYNNSSIYDNGIIIKGPNLISNLSLEHIKLIDNIDKNHIPGIYKIDNFYCLYIGTLGLIGNFIYT